MSSIDQQFVFENPHDIQLKIGNRGRMRRLSLNMPQTELAARAGIAVGTVKRFEKNGEIQFRHLLQIALVLGCLEDFREIFAEEDCPRSLFDLKEEKVRQRARGKKHL